MPARHRNKHAVCYGKIPHHRFSMMLCRVLMTDVVVENMASGKSVTLHCSAAVKKIAVYAHRLAVQVQDSISVYRLPAGTPCSS